VVGRWLEVEVAIVASMICHHHLHVVVVVSVKKKVAVRI
jgi:hypothetical protein